MIRRFPTLILLFMTVCCFQNCDSAHISKGADLGSNAATSVPAVALPPGTTLQVDPVLNSQALVILANRCGACHDTMVSGGVTQILDVNHLLASGLVVAGDPTQGRLIGAISAGTMPLTGTILPAEVQTLKDWITSMKLVGALPPSNTPPPPLPPGKTVQANIALHTQAMTVLNTNCAGCHEGAINGGVTNILDINNLVATGLVVAGDPTKGRLLGAIADGTMPAGSGARVTAADQQILKNWISSMTIVDIGPSAPAMPTRAALSPTFTGVFANIIQPKCIACHGPVLQHDLNLNSYSAVKARTSDIQSECQSGGMPRTPYPAVTSAELAALKAWIQAGALNN